jgi:hypothetical protein
MSIDISVCGILACPRIDSPDWQTRFSWTTVAEPDPEVAKEFLELEIDREGLAIGETDTDLLVATIHPGHIEHSELVVYADMPVDDEATDGCDWGTWTVCGVFRETGLCYSGLWSGPGPLGAYGAAFNHFHQRGRFLLLAGAHPGEQERFDWTPTFADPTCKTQEAMLSRLGELIPTGA